MSVRWTHTVPVASRMMTSDNDVTRLQQQQAAPVTVMAATASTTATRRHCITFAVETIIQPRYISSFPVSKSSRSFAVPVEDDVYTHAISGGACWKRHWVTCRPGVSGPVAQCPKNPSKIKQSLWNDFHHHETITRNVVYYIFHCICSIFFSKR